MKKILIADEISISGIEYLKSQPEFELLVALDSKPKEIIQQVKDVTAIIVRSETKITAEVITAATKLVVIGMKSNKTIETSCLQIGNKAKI